MYQKRHPPYDWHLNSHSPNVITQRIARRKLSGNVLKSRRETIYLLMSFPSLLSKVKILPARASLLSFDIYIMISFQGEMNEPGLFCSPLNMIWQKTDTELNENSNMISREKMHKTFILLSCCENWNPAKKTPLTLTPVESMPSYFVIIFREKVANRERGEKVQQNGALWILDLFVTFVERDCENGEKARTHANCEQLEHCKCGKFRLDNQIRGN